MCLSENQWWVNMLENCIFLWNTLFLRRAEDWIWGLCPNIWLLPNSIVLIVLKHGKRILKRKIILKTRLHFYYSKTSIVIVSRISFVVVVYRSVAGRSYHKTTEQRFILRVLKLCLDKRNGQVRWNENGIVFEWYLKKKKKWYFELVVLGRDSSKHTRRNCRRSSAVLKILEKMSLCSKKKNGQTI